VVDAPAPVQQAATAIDAARPSASSPRRIAARVSETRAASANTVTTTVSRVVATSPAPRSIAVAAQPAPIASGWRHASTEAVDSVIAAAAGLASPAAGQSNGPAFAAAAPSAGAAATALLIVLVFFAFSSQRHGTRVRLRPAGAPATPFLALLERPG
jgi:hypothetical protein